MKKILFTILAIGALATQAFAAYLPFIDDGGDTYVNNVYTTTVNGVIVKDHAYIYVKTTGDDTTGDGSGSKPFKTIQKAVDSLVDFVSPNTIYIFVGSGTYTENVVIPTTITGSIMIQGDTTHPENVVVKSASAIKQVFDIGCPARVSFAGMKIQDATSSFGVLATNAWVGFYNVQFYNNKTSVSSLSGSRVSFLGSSLGVSTIDGNDIASSYGITSDSTSIINIAQNLVIDNVDYGILNQSSSAYISSNVTITAKKIVWWSDKGAYNYIAGTQTFTGGGSGSSIFKLGHSELDFVSATLNMSTADYGFYGETGVKISEVGGTFNYEDITKEVYLDYDTVLDTTDSLSATPEFYKAASDYGYDERYISGEQSTYDTIVSYIDQDVKTTSSPTFDAVTTDLVQPPVNTDFNITVPARTITPGRGYDVIIESGAAYDPSFEGQDGSDVIVIPKYANVLSQTSGAFRVRGGVSPGEDIMEMRVVPGASQLTVKQWDDIPGEYNTIKLAASRGHQYLIALDDLEINAGTDINLNPEGVVNVDGTLNATTLVGTTITQGSLNRKAAASSVADDGTIDLPSSTSGWGEVMVGDNEEWTQFRWTTAGVVTLLNNTTNVVNTDTDTKFCIFDNGTKVTIKNALGSSKTVKYVINY
jgi:hypothetical protein